MSSRRDASVRLCRKNRSDFLLKLNNLIEIPSISTDPHHKNDMARAAQWLADELNGDGFSKIEVFSTRQHPIVYGEWMQAGSQAPTVLIYGHYDVQPAEPLELWESDPFQASIRGDNLFGRGASDMKGQIIATMSAVKTILRADRLPVNIKYLIEGEEEIGSPSLAEFLMEHKHLLACDFALNPDAGMISADTPTIIYALRGLAYFELRVFGPSHDLHSGLYGGIVHNPAIALSDLIAGMHDSDGKITLPGFYDRVRELTTKEREDISLLPMDEAYYLRNTGVRQLWGEKGYSPSERIGARPTLDVNGLFSGFTGSGSKTVIPAWAMAKISMRLVPDQDPGDVQKQLESYLSSHAPKSIRWELIPMAGSPASITNVNQKGCIALFDALKAVWGKAPLYKREGGSIPVVMDMQKILGVDSVLTGFGLPDDNLHAPNEKLHLPTWYMGIESLVHFFYNLAEK